MAVPGQSWDRFLKADNTTSKNNNEQFIKVPDSQVKLVYNSFHFSKTIYRNKKTRSFSNNKN